MFLEKTRHFLFLTYDSTQRQLLYFQLMFQGLQTAEQLSHHQIYLLFQYPIMNLHSSHISQKNLKEEQKNPVVSEPPWDKFLPSLYNNLPSFLCTLWIYKYYFYFFN